ncbi:DNA polymerase Y family protein [Hydrogenophaga sp.]|uniref:Y-family DNA polymerase n=1 Tax=Hydrogenophaga sp. TaxID=1904254 RepID=UPI00286E4F8C|nr:DNA polymerase Y family protein [Hydrogenophaga sp.]
MWWSALLPPDPSGTDAGAGAQARADALACAAARADATAQALALWALRFTPRVARLDEAVVMDVAASLRLFGGAAALRERVQAEATELGATRIAWAPNGLAALALARAVRMAPGALSVLAAPVDAAPLTAQLDPLPLTVLSATAPHRQTLAHIGCRTLGQLRRLPRAGLARRFDAALLHALDQLYGHAPQTPTWVRTPAVFDARLELPHRVDEAGALVFGARRLLLQLAGWLAARQAGTTAFTLHWAHDAMRSRGAGEGGQLTVRTAEPTREVEHLARLLAEHLARVTLAAPVGDLRLLADEVRPLAPRSASWLPDDAQSEGETLSNALERIAVRLGPDRVQCPVLVDDHRPEHMCRWQSAGQALPRRAGAPDADTAFGPGLPQPAFVLPQPLKLWVHQHRPLYQGELQLLLGPQRVEGGWWDRDEALGHTRHAVRDYWVAASAQAGLLWVFQTRLAEEPAWFLHGFFA